jgi:hypothetical protein
MNLVCLWCIINKSTHAKTHSTVEVTGLTGPTSPGVMSLSRVYSLGAQVSCTCCTRPLHLSASGSWGCTASRACEKHVQQHTTWLVDICRQGDHGPKEPSENVGCRVLSPKQLTQAPSCGSLGAGQSVAVWSWKGLSAHSATYTLYAS